MKRRHFLMFGGSAAAYGAARAAAPSSYGIALGWPGGPGQVTASPPSAPTLQALSLSPLTATAGSTYTGTITGQTAGSTLALTSNAGGKYSLSGTTVTGTGLTAETDTIQVTETLAGATNTPHQNNFNIVVSAAGAAIASLTVLGATGVDGTGAYGDGTTRPGVVMNGCAVQIVFPYVVGATLDVTKISISVSDPAYSAAGVATTRSRTIALSAPLRRQFTGPASTPTNPSAGATTPVIVSPLMTAQDGATPPNITMNVALSSEIYGATTLVSATAASGWYGAAATGAIGTISNGSSRAYRKAIGGFVTKQKEVGGSSFSVEFVAFHRHGMNGQMVAGVSFGAFDAQGTPNNTAVVSANAPTPSTVQTTGNIAEVYAATLTTTPLHDLDDCQVWAKVYPWIGDSSAVLDLTGSDAVAAYPTVRNHTRLHFKLNKAGSYGGAFAVVDATSGNDTTGVASKTLATAQGTPCATPEGALAKLQTFNNGQGTGNEPGGNTIYIYDHAGSITNITLATDFSTNNCAAWTYIKQDPRNTNTVTVTLTAQVFTVSLLAWQAPVICNGTNAFLRGDGSTVAQSYEGGLNISTACTVPVTYGQVLAYVRNGTLVCPAGVGPFDLYGNEPMGAQALGVTGTANSGTPAVRVTSIIGCNFNNYKFTDQSSGGTESTDGMIVYNNIWKNSQNSSDLDNTIVIGAAWVQNVGENISNTQRLTRFNADSNTLGAVNWIEAYNTFCGGNNRLYTEEDGTIGEALEMSAFGNLYLVFSNKTDTQIQFTVSEGRTGNWPVHYRTFFNGNVYGASATTQTNFVSNDGSQWLGAVLGRNDLQNVTFSTMFTNYQACAGDSTGAGAGGGTYSLTGHTNPAYGLMLGADQALRYDIVGARRNTGNDNGAAGAYARTAA